MDFDVQGHLDAVNRSVSSLERGGQPAREVTLSRTYPTIVEDLWDAVTNSQRIPRWFLPISGKLEPGGRYQLEGNAGGVITACERPAHLALTWEFGEDVSWVELRLSVDRAGGARLTLTHTAHLSEHWGDYGTGGGRRRSGPSRCGCSGEAHNRVLHWRIGRARLMHRPWRAPVRLRSGYGIVRPPGPPRPERTPTLATVHAAEASPYFLSCSYKARSCSRE